MSTIETPPWHGIIPPMITPLRGRDQLDEAGLERMIEHLIGGGVDGIFLLGTTGEAPALSYRLRRELMARACRQIAGRVPVLVGITDTSFVETVGLARLAAEAGADALVTSAPYYFPLSQPELGEYLQHLVPELPKPLFLYNMPGHTKVVFEPETVRRAMALPGVVGLKDSSGDMVHFHQLLQLLPERPEWAILIGPEELLAESLLLGGHGGVCGGANLFPRLYVALYRAAREERLDRVKALHAQVMQISTRLYRIGRHGSSFVKSLKCALREAGLADDFVAEPFHRFREEERAQVRSFLENPGIEPEYLPR